MNKRVGSTTNNPPDHPADEVHPLLDRQQFLQRFEAELAKARNGGSRLALLSVNLHDLTDLQALHGRHAADHVLAQLVHRLRCQLRRTAVLGRIGAVACTALLTDLQDGDELSALVHNIEGSLALPFPLGQQQHRMHLAMGVAVFPQDGQDVASLTQRAGQPALVRG